MCDHPNREAAMTVVARDDSGVPTIWCDPCLEPLVRALNAAGLATAASCCGHGQHPGWVILADDRHLLLADRTTAHRMMDHSTVVAERDELLARLTGRERQNAERLAADAAEGDTGICRTCARPITFATVEEPGYLPRTGWSDGARRDALVCFKAIGYQHVPLVGRERGIWDAATKAAEAALGAER